MIVLERAIKYTIALPDLTAESLREALTEGRRACSRIDKDVPQVSIPIAALDAWRDIVATDLCVPWETVTEYQGMRVSYNTMRHNLVVFRMVRHMGEAQ